MSALTVVEAPTPGDAGATPEEWLRRLGGPACLRIPGRDRSRVRALTTLLHGNEPSGLRALHGWVREGRRPAVDLLCFLGAVPAALEAPLFSQRARAEDRDLNRCFRPPFEGRQGRLAGEILERLRAARPEALIDVHNTSGWSPAYGVVTRLDPAREALVARFAGRLILTDLRLGAIMEATEDDFPTVTIECGKAGDAASDRVAALGLERYAGAEQVLERPAGETLRVLRHPVRIELRGGGRVAFGLSPSPDADVTLLPDLDKHNFSPLDPGTQLGWIGAGGPSALRARDGRGRELADELFRAPRGELRAARRLTPLMVTTDPGIAASDCLFYAVVD